jgi:hypothetical protein
VHSAPSPEQFLSQLLRLAVGVVVRVRPDDLTSTARLERDPPLSRLAHPLISRRCAGPRVADAIRRSASSQGTVEYGLGVAGRGGGAQLDERLRQQLSVHPRSPFQEKATRFPASRERVMAPAASASDALVILFHQ